jgi:hypothetical protein
MHYEPKSIKAFAEYRKNFHQQRLVRAEKAIADEYEKFSKRGKIYKFLMGEPDIDRLHLKAAAIERHIDHYYEMMLRAQYAEETNQKIFIDGDDEINYLHWYYTQTDPESHND